MKKIPFELPKRPPVRPTQSWAGIVPVLFRSRAAGYTIVNSELTTYTTGLTTELSETQLTNLDTFISALKTGLSITNLSDAFDVMYILAGETEESSLRNLVKNAHHCTNVHATAWVQYEGFTGDGANDYLDTNYNANTQGVKYTLNNASMGVYIRNSIAAANKIAIGMYIARFHYIMPFNASSKVEARLNSSTNPYVNTSVANSQGVTIVTRDGASEANFYGYRNKTNLATITGVGNTTGIDSLNTWILARNNNGSIGSASDYQCAFAFMGGHISTAMRDIIVDAIEVYMDANGKGVL